MKKHIWILLISLALCSIAAYCQIKPRIAGLENNSEYMELLAKEEKLRTKEDSLSRTVTTARKQYREQPERRDFFRDEILRLEGEIFDVRNESGIIAGKINMIEQEFIINNLDSIYGRNGHSNNSDTGIGKVNTWPNLVANDYFKLKLFQEDYKSLLEAQAKELPVASLIKQYLKNYDTLSSYAKRYSEAQSETVADSILSDYNRVETINDSISASIARDFDYIIDHKTYSYNFIIDRMNLMDLLADFEKAGIICRDEVAKAKDNAMSITVTSYPIRKKLLFDYEKFLAAHLGFENALDSLVKAEEAMDSVDYSAPRIVIPERLFLDYSDISFYSTSKYNVNNPIPKCAVYDKGVIYRILVGSFLKPQAISIFKGAYPLGYLKTKENRYEYYAGGFANRAKAEEAVETLKKHGFRNPKIVVWDYGVYTILDAGEQGTAKNTEQLFRVEIEGAGSNLPDNIKNAIQTAAENKDIMRIGTTFIISPFSTVTEAEKTAEAVRETNPELRVKISKIAL